MVVVNTVYHVIACFDPRSAFQESIIIINPRFSGTNELFTTRFQGFHGDVVYERGRLPRPSTPESHWTNL